MASSLCSTRFLLLFVFVVSAIPIAFIIAIERAPPSTHQYHYHGQGWLRECAKWDDLNRRFLVSFLEGGVGGLRVPRNYSPGVDVLEEIAVVKDTDVAGNASLGISIDRPRNRLLVAVADLIGNRYSALAAYDLSSWNRLFLTQLSGPGSNSFEVFQIPTAMQGNRRQCFEAFEYRFKGYRSSLSGLSPSPSSLLILPSLLHCKITPTLTY
ncbi:hypothetical protein Nepgr_025415 [Nepenthes gracilis]|uniref:Uncharacterized protein n=1 Tax=Nepenthes gracilis TaxID=150966 RepID=A0AAD3T6D9_NEPGR|nr:hypothetical protein Nepgr_025415 [Nepenthes gracilis]